jgi:hypothetical protein
MKERQKDYMRVEMLLESMNLTAEERGLHKEPMRNCLKNEQKLTECAAATRNNIERISTVLSGIYKNRVSMEAALDNLTKGAEELSLRMIAADKFYHE